MGKLHFGRDCIKGIDLKAKRVFSIGVDAVYSVALEGSICRSCDGVQKEEVDHPSSSCNTEGKSKHSFMLNMIKPALNHCDLLESQSNHTGRTALSPVRRAHKCKEQITSPTVMGANTLSYFSVDGGRVSGRRWPGES
jgi:hypothetical protein